MKAVILSTALILENGIFNVRKLTLAEAQKWMVEHPEAANYCGHQTVKVLGIEPATTREQCTGYDAALCLAAVGRVEFGREYTLDEILEIGYLSRNSKDILKFIYNI